MSKQNLIDTIAAQQSTSKAEATRVVHAFLAGLEGELANGRNVTLVGFATGGEADQGHVLQVQCLDHRGQIVGVVVHVVAFPGLT